MAIDLRVDLTPAGSKDAATVCDTSFTNMYWTMAQQLAHATVNGATVRAGDLFASGTVSGPTPDQFGSLLERSWNGTTPIEVSGGTRTFLEDGDSVSISARCEIDSQVTIGFGVCEGTITA